MENTQEKFTIGKFMGNVLSENRCRKNKKREKLKIPRE